jgi:3-oxoacyl-[acyl-carrier-protein] synthase-3
MNDSQSSGEDRLRQIVENCLRRVLEPDSALPADDVDWIEASLLDSMGHVDVLLCIEKAAGLTDFFNRIESAPPRTIRLTLTALRGAEAAQEQINPLQDTRPQESGSVIVEIAGWGFAVGAQRIEASALEAEFGLSAGTIRERAGIDSVTRVNPDETEVSLAVRAAKEALKQADLDASELDWILASSETFLGFPSLGALVHSQLLLRETCGVLEIGGACVGLLNALFTAKLFLTASAARHVLVVTSDVHSRRLSAGRVPGEFGALFGDGASAFVLSLRKNEKRNPHYRLGVFQFGCTGTLASALGITACTDGKLELRFEGEALARAAVLRLERIIADLQLQLGVDRNTVAGLATHQPNPRLVELLAKQTGFPFEKFPVVAKIYGNLGSSTCGVALCIALTEHGTKPAAGRGPVLLAAVGPGMLWGGGVVF